MNEKTNTPSEPLAALVAQMRGWAKDGVAVVGTGYIADRIEAAAKRERVEIRRDAEIEWTRIGYEERKAEEKRAPGNAAAQREALERCNELFRCDDDNKSLLCHLARKADEATQAALAATARNCDRFANAKEARKAFESAHSHGIVHNLYTAAFDWLFDTAEGGAE